MSTTITALTHVFEGEPLQTIEWDGRPCWAAKPTGVRIGYEDGGKRFVRAILHDWAEEFEEGRDYAFLTGDDLMAYKAISHQGREAPQVDRSAHVLVLFESGMHMALLKTHKPLGARLRRFLADEVLPQIARTGAYVPDEAIAAVNARVDRLEHHAVETDSALRQLASAVASIATDIKSLAVAVDQSTRATAALVERLSLPGPSAAGVVVQTPEGALTLAPSQAPSEFTVRGLKNLARAVGCTWQAMRRRLVQAGLLGDGHWCWVGKEGAYLGGRPQTVTAYAFRPGILEELRRREAPLFEGAA